MLDIEEIRKAIAAAGAAWTATETPIFRAGARAGAPSLLFGLRLDDDAGRLRPASSGMFDNLAKPPPPPKVDWRAAGSCRR